jgi:CRISPR-associated endonuclease Csn1
MEAMKSQGVRSFGEFLYKLRLSDSECRLRERYTQRQWFRDEFDLLCASQKANGLVHLDDDLVKELRHAIFFQRPLRIRKGMIGKCTFETGKYRAASALLSSQRFRLLQDVNHLRLEDEQFHPIPLTPEQREHLISALDEKESLSFAKARKIVGAARGAKFNLERGEREDLTGNSTASRIMDAIGIEKWQASSKEVREQIVEALMSMEDRDALSRLAQRKWGLDAQSAEQLAEVDLEDGHISLSTKAVRKLLPYLESGLSYTEAVQKAYPENSQQAAVAVVPPIPMLRNPIVQRTLAETRRVVNAIIAKHGKPSRIRIELARDLKKTAKAREAAVKGMRERAKDRSSAAARLLVETGSMEPKSYDIEKVLLHEECGGICPYTGKAIPFNALFGDSVSVDVEHIIPFSRSLDNSFANKTLCYADENRHVKHDRTPYEAYHNQPEKWEGIVERIRKYKGTYRDEKLRRFLLEDVQEETSSFCTQDLNDTRYASRYAAECLAQLYLPEDRMAKIQVSVGQITAYLRSAWRLNELLSPTNRKNRDDHRHHAVDALAIALTNASITRALALASSRSYRPGVFQDVDLPWPTFRLDATQCLADIIVSHRVDHKVNGKLHKDTFYGIIRSGKEYRAVLRKPLASLSEQEIKKGLIVDKAVREAVESRLKEFGAQPSDLFQDPLKLPRLRTKTGREILIRRVRVFQDIKPESVGDDKGRRVMTGANHHLEVFNRKTPKGATKWQGQVVSRLDAMIRKKAGKPIVATEDEQGNPLVLSLAIGDTVRLNLSSGTVVAVVQKLSECEYVFRPHNEGGKAKENKESIGIWSAEGLRKAECSVLKLSPLGEIIE